VSKEYRDTAAHLLSLQNGSLSESGKFDNFTFKIPNGMGMKGLRHCKKIRIYIATKSLNRHFSSFLTPGEAEEIANIFAYSIDTELSRNPHEPVKFLSGIMKNDSINHYEHGKIFVIDYDLSEQEREIPLFEFGAGGGAPALPKKAKGSHGIQFLDLC
jgi:hypothetical protein